MKPQLTFVGQKLVAENTGLIGYTMGRYFNSHQRTHGEKMADAGLDGLIQAAISYDSFRGIRFSTLAVKCIFREIIGALKSNKKESVLYSASLSEVPGEVLVEEYDHEYLRDIHLQLEDAMRDFRKANKPKHVEIFISYYHGGKTLKEVGDAYNLSRERIRQIIFKMKDNFRNHRNKIGKKIVPKKRKHSIHKLTHNGKTMAIHAWANELGIPCKTLYARYKVNKSPDFVLRSVKGRKKVEA